MDRREKSDTASKEGTANAAIAEVVAVVPSEDDSARVKYEHYQSLMSATEELDIGIVQVVHSDTVFVEDTNSGIHLLYRRTSIPGNHMSWDNST